MYIKVVICNEMQQSWPDLYTWDNIQKVLWHVIAIIDMSCNRVEKQYEYLEIWFTQNLGFDSHSNLAYNIYVL